MTSTDMKIGMPSVSRPSSRVLKPPGGGHTNIFGESEIAVNAPRPKYNQQNSSNLNACIGSTDPNDAVEKLREEISHTKPTTTNNEEATKLPETKANPSNGINNTGNNTNNTNSNGNNSNARTGRVPPGGFSSGGFW